MGGKEGLIINVQEEKGVLYFNGGNSLISCTYILDKYMSKLIKLHIVNIHFTYVQFTIRQLTSIKLSKQKKYMMRFKGNRYLCPQVSPSEFKLYRFFQEQFTNGYQEH